ncbi:NUDIX hydrolase [Nocardioides jejuensis]|uniref:NUDIX hydrolase n=1 Tax=Nocardioides jejuensis TaxID=2502782 RepID=A0A4R1CIC0_9ACTN|nr:NUDIX domain-containing protein [Nocardioides jejuensis]TCJ29876.1 NUDIX hydrolase [Nocardioides jejuensis]
MERVRPLASDQEALARALADGDGTAVEPRPAATVVVVRDGDGTAGGVETWLLHRHQGMEFAAGMYVFPGGGVDPRDAELAPELWAGPSAADWAERLDCPPEQARELVCAAVRETFEETGVLLAGTPDAVVTDTTSADWEADRAALESHALSLAELLTRRGLVLRTDLLAGMSCWVTPPMRPRRYRTWFFVARLPEGQVARDVSTESDHVGWHSMRAALGEVVAGRMTMLPPTYATLAELYDATTPESAVKLAREVPWQVVEPYFDADAGGLVVPEHLNELAERVVARLQADT